VLKVKAGRSRKYHGRQSSGKEPVQDIRGQVGVVGVLCMLMIPQLLLMPYMGRY
jgi:hypothetical protein